MESKLEGTSSDTPSNNGSRNPFSREPNRSTTEDANPEPPESLSKQVAASAEYKYDVKPTLIREERPEEDGQVDDRPHPLLNGQEFGKRPVLVRVFEMDEHSRVPRYRHKQELVRFEANLTDSMTSIANRIDSEMSQRQSHVTKRKCYTRPEAASLCGYVAA